MTIRNSDYHNEIWIKQGVLYFRLPVNPPKLQISNKEKRETVTLEGIGETTLLSKNRSPLSFSFESQLPRRPFPNCEYWDIMEPVVADEILEVMKNTGPVQFIVTNTPINLTCTIDDYSKEERGGDVGTIYFNMTLTEYRFKPARYVRYGGVSTGSGKTQGQQVLLKKSSARQDTKKTPKTYKVVQGDYLIKIARKVYKNSNRWTDIAKLNGLKKPYTIYPNQTLKLP